MENKDTRAQAEEVAQPPEGRSYPYQDQQEQGVRVIVLASVAQESAKQTSFKGLSRLSAA